MAVEMRYPTFAAIAVGGIVAGIIDIGAAALINLLSPTRVLHFVAGGLYGKAAMQGGMSMTLQGAALQIAMSMIIAAIYVVAYRNLPLLRRSWMAGGLAYGVAIFVVMNYVVMPLSAWARVPRFTIAQFAENMVAMLLFGVIIAYVAQRFLQRPVIARR